MNNKAYQKMDYALCLLSAAADGRRHGCIVNSFHQVTSSFPPKFTVAVNRDHETCKAIQAAGSFSVTLLAENAPGALIDLFGYKSGRVVDKFEGQAAETDGNGNPYLKEHMVSRIACKVVDRLEIGNFLLFVGQATEAEVLGDEKVLTLQAYTEGHAAHRHRVPHRGDQRLPLHRLRLCVRGGVPAAGLPVPPVQCPGGEVRENRKMMNKPRAKTARGLFLEELHGTVGKRRRRI